MVYSVSLDHFTFNSNKHYFSFIKTSILQVISNATKD